MPIEKYFKGKGAKVMDAMTAKYGKEKGEKIFYSTANKMKKKKKKDELTEKY